MEKDMERKMEKEYITHQKFRDLFEELVCNYNNDYETDVPILAFLDRENINRELLMKINPLDIVREFHRCDMNCNILRDYTDSTEFTTRFRILMGLCECVSWVNRPAPKFKYKDIIMEKKTNRVFYVMDFVDEDDSYCFDDVGGNSEYDTREFVERNFVKIGEVTDDVIENLKKRNR